MNVLFVYSGNKPTGIGILVKNQAISLQQCGIDISFSPVLGKGLRGYCSSILNLKKILSTTKFDLVHAHYSFSAYAASISGAKPMVVSLMGSDINGHWINKFIIRLFYHLFKWKRLIIKSGKLSVQLGMKNSEIIPNGVDTDHFRPIEKTFCTNQLGWDHSKKNILFAANPARSEKNFKLAENTLKYIHENSLVLHVLDNVPYKDMPLYFNAADVILLTSQWEGSPNVIKEAMACNRPIVSTDVGDVRELTEGIPGCLISNNNPEDIANKIRQALEHYQSIGARQRIIDRGLESNETARKIIAVYEQVIHKKSKN